MDVLHRFVKVILSADVAIPIFAVPDGAVRNLTAFPPEFANLPGGELFPGRNDFGYRPVLQRLEKNMHMIRHDHPGEKAVALRVEGEERFLGRFSDGWIPQDAGAVPRVDPGVDPLAAFGVALMGGK